MGSKGSLVLSRRSSIFFCLSSKWLESNEKRKDNSHDMQPLSTLKSILSNVAVEAFCSATNARSQQNEKRSVD